MKNEKKSNYHLIPNFTQYPNILLDEINRTLSPAEQVCLNWIVRKTYGFHKGRDKIAHSQFEYATGMSKGTVKSALSKLMDRGLITQHSPGQGRISAEYSINLNYRSKIGDLPDIPEGQELTPRGSKSDPQRVKNCPPEGQELTPRGSKSDPTKETLKERSKYNLNKDEDKSLSPNEGAFRLIMAKYNFFVAVDLNLDNRIRNLIQEALKSNSIEVILSAIPEFCEDPFWIKKGRPIGYMLKQEHISRFASQAAAKKPKVPKPKVPVKWSEAPLEEQARIFRNDKGYPDGVSTIEHHFSPKGFIIYMNGKTEESFKAAVAYEKKLEGLAN